MASIRITQFGGLMPEVTGRIKPATSAQIAHNCLLTDGSLRPQAKWVRLETYQAGVEPVFRSVVYDPLTDKAIMYAALDAVAVDGEPFPDRAVFGAKLEPSIVRHKTGIGASFKTVALQNDSISGSVTYSPGYFSKKPTNRIYAASRVRIIDGQVEEGGLCGPIGDPTQQVFEGDTANLTFNFVFLDDEADHIRIYRSITGLDTGEAITNDLDTNWHLIAQIPVPAVSGGIVYYLDGGSATTDPLDVNYSGQFHPPQIQANFFGLTESGWYVAGALNGTLQISERFLHYAWPSDNTLRIPNTVTDMVCSNDNVYVGTLGVPYVVAIQTGDKATQSGATPYEEFYPCLPGSMTASPGGALYASSVGIVSLSREGLRVLTAALVNAGDILYSKTIPATKTDSGEPLPLSASIGDTNYGVYYNGAYMGFCGGGKADTFYVTSMLYPAEVLEKMTAGGVAVEGNLSGEVYEYEEGLDAQAAVYGGALRTILKSYKLWAPEGIDVTSTPISGSLRVTLVSFDILFSSGGGSTVDYEAIDVVGTPLGGTLKKILISYVNWPFEAIDVTSTVISGTLI